MRTSIRLHLAAPAAAVVLALMLGACSPVPGGFLVRDRAGSLSCVLGGVDGDLVRRGDTAVLVNAGWNGRHWGQLALRWPPGYTARSIGVLELEVLDANGDFVARTGTHAFISAVSEDTVIQPLVRDGVLEVCPG